MATKHAEKYTIVRAHSRNIHIGNTLQYIESIKKSNTFPRTENVTENKQNENDSDEDTANAMDDDDAVDGGHLNKTNNDDLEDHIQFELPQIKSQQVISVGPEATPEPTNHVTQYNDDNDTNEPRNKVRFEQTPMDTVIELGSIRKARSFHSPTESDRNLKASLSNLEDHDVMTGVLNEWSLEFKSEKREAQFRIFVTEEYGTTIRIAILCMLCAYLFLAGTNGRFLKHSTSLTLVTIGFCVIVVTFTLATSFSVSPSSPSIHYLKAAFEMEVTSVEQASKRLEYLHKFCLRLFAEHSQQMMAVSAVSLLLLPILQNTIIHTITDHEFIIHYLMCSLAISSYGCIRFVSYILMNVFLIFVWNICAICAMNTHDNKSFSFAFVNVTLIIGASFMTHQVSGRDYNRRLSFVRAMKHVHKQREKEILLNEQREKAMRRKVRFRKTRSQPAKKTQVRERADSDQTKNDHKQPIHTRVRSRSLPKSQPNLMPIRRESWSTTMTPRETTELGAFAMIKFGMGSSVNFGSESSGRILSSGDVAVSKNTQANTTDPPNKIEISQIIQSKIEKAIVSIHELPEWYQEYTYILSGYRIGYDYMDCIKSLLQWHNETVNVWTEWLPAFALIALVIVWCLQSSFLGSQYKPLSIVILALAILVTALRGIVSGCAHLFFCVSEQVSETWWRTDRVFIILISGVSAITSCHCMFYCYENTQIFYFVSILVLGASTAITSFTTTNHLIKEISLGTYITFCLMFLYCYEMYLYTSTKRDNMPPISILYWTLGIVCLVVSMVIRTIEFPEAFIVKSKFKRILKQIYSERNNGKVLSDDDGDKIDDVDDVNSFENVMREMQSFSQTVQNQLAKIEDLDQFVNNDKNAKCVDLMSKQNELKKEIAELERSISNELSREKDLKECTQLAFMKLVAETKNDWFHFIGTNHNLWHILVDLSTIFTLIAYKEFFDWVHSTDNFCG